MLKMNLEYNKGILFVRLDGMLHRGSTYKINNYSDLLDLKNRKIAIEEEVLKKPDYSSAIESLAREIKAIEKELNING